MNMKFCFGCNFRKHRETKGSYEYTALDISLKFDSLDKMKIKSSESKDNLEISGNGLITSLGLRAKARSEKYKKARYAIGNVSEKDISRIIRDFEKLPYELYERKMPKHEATETYFYLVRQLAKCTMIDDALN